MALAAAPSSVATPAARWNAPETTFSCSCPAQELSTFSPLRTRNCVRTRRARGNKFSGADRPRPVVVCADGGAPEAMVPVALEGADKVPEKKAGGTTVVGEGDEDRVVEIHNQADFDAALAEAKNKLVVVEYAASHSRHSAKMYPSMVELSKQTEQVVCLLVMGDESPETEALCRAAGVEKVPYFTFYKNGEKIHEEQGVDPEMLMADVIYYGENDAPVQQLKSIADVEGLLQEHAKDGKLVVIDVSLKSCGPCVKVYPTVLKLSRQMGQAVIFARLFGDETQDTGNFMKRMGVVEVPTFLFIRDGKLCGRYVGSGRGELIGEVLRYQGVRVTY